MLFADGLKKPSVQVVQSFKYFAGSNLIREPDRFRHRGNAELALERGAQALIVPHRIGTLSVEDQKYAEVPMDGFSKRVCNQDFPCRCNRVFIATAGSVGLYQFGRGSNVKRMKTFSFFENPISVFALKKWPQIGIDRRFERSQPFSRPFTALVRQQFLHVAAKAVSIDIKPRREFQSHFTAASIEILGSVTARFQRQEPSNAPQGRVQRGASSLWLEMTPKLVGESFPPMNAGRKFEQVSQ